VQACFNEIPSKPEMVERAIDILEGFDAPGWFLLVEQSQSDKMAHPLEIERTIYEVIEMDIAVGVARERVTNNGSDGLIIVTADHAQPESIIGVALPGAITPGGATPPGGCFFPSSGNTYPITVGSGASETSPCPLQDVIGTFNDGTFPTYADANGDGFPDDPDPSVKLIVEQAGRPTYSTDFLTNPIPLFPIDFAGSAAVPNPLRDPGGLLQTGNMPSAARVGAAPKGGGVTVAPHSTDDVPLLAYGAQAGLFSGFYENSDVSVVLAAALSSKRNLNFQFGKQRGEARSFTPGSSPSAAQLNFDGAFAVGAAASNKQGAGRADDLKSRSLRVPEGPAATEPEEDENPDYEY
jgi:alkaline phosphatase